MTDANSYLEIGRVVDVYGLKGWVKVKSFTDPEINFVSYQNCFIKNQSSWIPIEIEQSKIHGKGLIVKFKGYDDRTDAEKILKSDISVKTESLPKLEVDEYYWRDLVGLDVWTNVNAVNHLLGKISHLLETGSNDVLFIKPCEGSFDNRERLLPYRPEVILSIDLISSKMIVDWDVEF